MKTGEIRKYDTERGFGFIACDDGSSVFFHISSLVVVFMPAAGMLVEFEEGVDPQNPNRTRAEKVKQRLAIRKPVTMESGLDAGKSGE